MGVTLIETDLLRSMKRRPWFTVGYNQEFQTFMGEDVYFWLQVREQAGIRPMLDQDLTREIAHVGRFEFTPEHAIKAQAARAAAEVQPEDDGSGVGEMAHA